MFFSWVTSTTVLEFKSFSYRSFLFVSFNLIIVIIARINFQQIIDRVSHLVLVLRLRRMVISRSHQSIIRWAALAHLRWLRWRRWLVAAAVPHVVALNPTALLEHHLRCKVVHRLRSLGFADLLMVILLLLLMVLRILTGWWWRSVATAEEFRCDYYVAVAMFRLIKF